MIFWLLFIHNFLTIKKLLYRSLNKKIRASFSKSPTKVPNENPLAPMVFDRLLTSPFNWL
jgi:hypothetical protein